jgi:glutaredoxin
MDKVVILFTMESCPYCHMLKEMLDKENITYYDRDIHKHKEEYDMFVEATQNEFVPVFMLIESPESEEPSTNLYAPERDFDDLEDGVTIIKEFFER